MSHYKLSSKCRSLDNPCTLQVICPRNPGKPLHLMTFDFRAKKKTVNSLAKFSLLGGGAERQLTEELNKEELFHNRQLHLVPRRVIFPQQLSASYNTMSHDWTIHLHAAAWKTLVTWQMVTFWMHPMASNPIGSKIFYCFQLSFLDTSLNFKGCEGFIVTQLTREDP